MSVLIIGRHSMQHGWPAAEARWVTNHSTSMCFLLLLLLLFDLYLAVVCFRSARPPVSIARVTKATSSFVFPSIRNP